MQKQKAVIFDIDGTLSIISAERQALIKTRSWDKFHRLSICASANGEVVSKLLEHHTAGRLIILITARPARWLESTEHWLEKNYIPYHALFMRKNGDKRKSFHSKKEHIDSLLKFATIIEAWDDRQQDIDLLRSYGIRTIKVEGQYEG